MMAIDHLFRADTRNIASLNKVYLYKCQTRASSFTCLSSFTICNKHRQKTLFFSHTLLFCWCLFFSSSKLPKVPSFLLTSTDLTHTLPGGTFLFLAPSLLYILSHPIFHTTSTTIPHPITLFHHNHHSTLHLASPFINYSHLFTSQTNKLLPMLRLHFSTKDHPSNIFLTIPLQRATPQFTSTHLIQPLTLLRIFIAPSNLSSPTFPNLPPSPAPAKSHLSFIPLAKWPSPFFNLHIP